MNTQTLLTILAAVTLVLAGCSGTTPADGGATPEDDTADGEDGTTEPTDDDSEQTNDITGTVAFYLSDKPSQIDDFRHLNVTIDRVGFHRAESTTTATPNATATATATNTTTAASEDAEESDEKAGEITREVDARSVDLTRLKGENATLIGTPQIPAGNYTKVFVYVDSINATLTDGSTTNVKLPSQKLQLTKGFTLEPNGTVSFVYDISIFEAGNSGKYILKPVISESGPDTDLRDVDAEESDASDDADPDGDGSTDSTATATPSGTGTDNVTATPAN